MSIPDFTALRSCETIIQDGGDFKLFRLPETISESYEGTDREDQCHANFRDKMQKVLYFPHDKAGIMSSKAERIAQSGIDFGLTGL